MELVVKISEEEYYKIKVVVQMGLGTNIDEAVANGTPLPKIHGRLIDADAFIANESCCGYIEDMDIDSFNSATPTIIEAEY